MRETRRNFFAAQTLCHTIKRGEFQTRVACDTRYRSFTGKIALNKGLDHGIFELAL